MSNHEEYLIPREVDAPIPIFSWEITELVVALVVLGLGLILRMFPVGIIGALVVLWGAKKIRAGAKRGQVQHLLWRLGLNLDTPLKRYGPKPLHLEFFK